MNETRFSVGEWAVDADANQITGPDGPVVLEPRVMDLLVLFAKQPGEVVSKPDIIKALWGEVHVNDDALTRCVFKLRKALGDDARAARYVATVPKRGYKFVAEVRGPRIEPPAAGAHWRGAAVIGGVVLTGLLVMVLVWSLMQNAGTDAHVSSQIVRIERADGFYHQFTRADNEAALRLYSDVLEDEPDNAAALAGLANALTQRLIRYQGPGGEGAGRTTLTQALESGWLESETAQAGLARATALARRATELDPSHARAWRALGLALTADRSLTEAERAYERALLINPDDWGTMINLSELQTLLGHPDRALPYMEQAWLAMERRYADDPVEIRPWHSEVGLSVARSKQALGALEEAELWYRRVLSLDPLNREAVRGLTQLLENAGDTADATALCEELARATGEGC